MDAHRYRLVLIALAALIGGLAPAAPTEAAECGGGTRQQTTVRVRTTDDGIKIAAHRCRYRAGSSGGSSRSTTSRPRCRWVPWEGRPYWYLVVCDGRVTGSVYWRPRPQPPQTTERDLRRLIPLPEVSIQANPNRGMVGVESWFWLRGYTGETITRTVDALGSPIKVRVDVEEYRWRFGDGARITTDTPGSPYPRRSEVRHTYQRSSLGRVGGYRVRCVFEFTVSYRVDDGSWRRLDPITRTAETYYPVRESQAVIRR